MVLQFPRPYALRVFTSKTNHYPLAILAGDELTLDPRAPVEAGDLIVAMQADCYVIKRYAPGDVVVGRVVEITRKP